MSEPYPGSDPFHSEMRRPSSLTPRALCQWLEAGHYAAIFFDGGGNHHYVAVSSIILLDDGSGDLWIADPLLGRNYELRWYAGSSYGLQHRTRGGAKHFTMIE